MRRYAQLAVVLLCASALKLYYSTASPNQLRWILAPTTAIVELVSGRSFVFESYAGYISSDHTFLIAAACAGVNFLITAFLMLSLRRLWRDRSQNISWIFIPASAVSAYLATLVTNAVRISIALRLQHLSAEAGWLSRDQLHRFEGILVYFGFLLLLYVVSERMNSRSNSSHKRKRLGVMRLCCFPLLIYYLTTLILPFANGAYREGFIFWQHSLFVLLVPMALLLVLTMLRFLFNERLSPLLAFARRREGGPRSISNPLPFTLPK